MLKTEFQNTPHVVTYFRNNFPPLIIEIMLSLTTEYVVLGIAAHLKYSWDHRLFIVVVYKNMLCFEGALSSC